MKRFLTLVAGACLLATASLSAQDAFVRVHDAGTGVTIPAEIYGQFSEHLGRCIYGGLWVGKDSSVPNVEGYRKDVFDALKALKVPVMRWPGGCFADDYHWMDGIGPQEKRGYLTNNNWGGTLEDNSYRAVHQRQRGQRQRRGDGQMGGVHDLRRQDPDGRPAPRQRP